MNMAEGPINKEQQRLMHVGSHSGEDANERDTSRRVYEDDASSFRKLIRSKTAKLVVMLVFIVGYFFTELVVGHVTGSLTLVADSFHMLSDALSLIIALVAVRMSRRSAADPFQPWLSKEPYFNTFGWARFEVLGAMVNSTFLLALCITIAVEAIEKFTLPEPVEDPKLVLAVGGGGLAVYLFGLVLFGSHFHGHGRVTVSQESESGSEIAQKPVAEEQHMNMKAAFLHILGDALGSIVVMVSACVLWLVPVSEDSNQWTLYLDPAMSMVLVCIMVFTTVPLFKQSSLILLQTVPRHIELESIHNKLKNIPGIQTINDLHIWQLAGDWIVASVHVQCANTDIYLKVVQKVKVALHNCGMRSVTVQVQPEYQSPEHSPFCQEVCGESCCPRDNTELVPSKAHNVSVAYKKNDEETSGPTVVVNLKTAIPIEDERTDLDAVESVNGPTNNHCDSTRRC